MIVTHVACPDDPRLIRDERMCLYPVSKNARGQLHLTEGEMQECADRKCTTLKTMHLLELDVRSNNKACDAPEAGVFNGSLVSRDLASAFVRGDGRLRGLHGGHFRLEQGLNVLVTGELSGVTNAGTHRRPFDPACQECNAPGFMEGRFCGVIRRARQKSLIGCAVIGTYKLQLFEPEDKGGDGPLQGVMEGVIVCGCD
jgi:hypothetical protein